ncbi:MAG: RNA polymerase sigma factor, partial [Acidobacteria bacterium]|nr:RNA polymerase sigma factor [Acidobacteriota bacterium]
EIAEISQVPAGTVKSRILRGREALRHLLTSNSGAASVFALGVVK